MKRSTTPSWALLAAAAAAALACAPAAAQVRAYAGAVAGLAQGGNGVFGCATSGPTIGNGWFAGISLPTEGFAACHLAGSIDDKTAAGGTLSAASTATGAADNGGTATVAAQARAAYWQLGVAANGSNTGGASAFHYRQGAAFASFTDTITLTSPGIAAGSAGAVNFAFLIDGVMRSNPVAPYGQQGDVSLGIRVDGRFIWTPFAATVLGSDLPFVRGGSTGLPGAFVVGPGALAGSALVNSTANFDIRWGVPFSVEVALLTSVSPCCYGATMSADFANTAVLRGIDAYGPNGRVADFSVAATSGSSLSALGLASPVPEPATAGLAAAGVLLTLLLAARSRRQHDRR